MAIEQDVQAKLQALLDEAKVVAATLQNVSMFGGFADVAMAQRWATKAEALFTSVFGPQSHFVRDVQRIVQESVRHENWPETQIKVLWGVVAAAVDSWRDGFVFNLRVEAEAEVESALLDSAAHDLANVQGVNAPELRAAAVLAGSVLERHLRRLYMVHGGTGDPEKLTIDPLSVELKKTLGVIGVPPIRWTGFLCDFS